jgi:hypothetical protein
MTIVRDDPSSPDEGFAELYAQLPDASDLWPWLELAQEAAPPVLYLGIGTGRLAVPLADRRPRPRPEVRPRRGPFEHPVLG